MHCFTNSLLARSSPVAGLSLLLGTLMLFGQGNVDKAVPETTESLVPPLTHQEAIHAVAYSPDGKTVATGSGDHTAQVWDASTGKRVGEPLRHQGQVQSVTYSPDGRTLVTGSADKTARVWETSTGKPVTPSLEHQ